MGENHLSRMGRDMNGAGSIHTGGGQRLKHNCGRFPLSEEKPGPQTGLSNTKHQCQDQPTT